MQIVCRKKHVVVASAIALLLWVSPAVAEPIFFITWMQGDPGAPTAFRTDVCYDIGGNQPLCHIVTTGGPFTDDTSDDTDAELLSLANADRQLVTRSNEFTNALWADLYLEDIYHHTVFFNFPPTTTKLNDVAGGPWSTSYRVFFATDIGVVRYVGLTFDMIRTGSYVSVAYDDLHQVLYAATAGGAITSHNADGDLLDLLHLSTTERPLGLAVDKVADKLYWHTDYKIKRADTSGYESNLETIYNAVGSDTIKDIEVFPGSNSLYGLVVDASEWVIFRANLDGTSATIKLVDLLPGGGWHPVGFDVYEPGCALGLGSLHLFGDVTPGWDVINFTDINKVVQCFQGYGSASERARCDLSPCITWTNSCLGDGDIGFHDIENAVDAFQGRGCR